MLDLNLFEVHIRKLLLAAPIHKDLKQGDFLLPLFINFILEYAIRKVQNIRRGIQIEPQ
jgi:hypothetical protein